MKSLKQILAESLASRSKTAIFPSQNSTYDPSHTKTPYHKDLKKHGYQYTHSVRHNQNTTVHHYLNKDNHGVWVTTSTYINHKMDADSSYPDRMHAGHIER